MDYDYSGFTYNTLREWLGFIDEEFPGFDRPEDVDRQRTQIETEMATRRFVLLVRHEGQVVKELARYRTEGECSEKGEGFLGEYVIGGMTYAITVEAVSS